MKMLTKGPLTIMLILSSIQYLCGGCCGCCKTKTENKTKNTKPTPPNKTKTLGKKTSTQPDKTTEPDNSGDKSNNPSTKQPNDLENKTPSYSFEEFKPKDFNNKISNLTGCSINKIKAIYGICKRMYSDGKAKTETCKLKKEIKLDLFAVINFKNIDKSFYKIVMNENDLNDKEGEIIIKFKKNTEECTINYTPPKK